MRGGTWSILLVTAVFLAQALVSQQQTCDPLCQTHTCDVEGNCVCPNPPYTPGERPFLGGLLCNQPSDYCNGSRTFWCVKNDLNSTCAKAPDGNYTCSCHPGYAGEHCELAGTLCGVDYCYNNATCLNGATCGCLEAWRGNANCSLATPEGMSSGAHVAIKWWGGLLITGAVMAVLSVLAVVLLHKYRERMEGVNRFRELQKSQMRGRPESDDDEYDSDVYDDEVSKSRAKPSGT